jgi:putative hydrolase of the HAD superfamily
MESALARQRGDRFVYVGDNPSKDFLAPNQLGWTTVLIDRPALRPTRIHKLCEPPAGGAPQFTIASLDELDEAIG